jgi:hypothetical protein
MMTRGRVAVAIYLSAAERWQLEDWTKSADDILATIEHFRLANLRITQAQQPTMQTSDSGL